MVRKVAVVFLTVAWLALCSFQLLDDLDPGGAAAYGSRPVKATLSGLGQAINQEDDGLLKALHKLPWQADYSYPLPVKSIFSFGADEKVTVQRTDLDLYKLHSVLII